MYALIDKPVDLLTEDRNGSRPANNEEQQPGRQTDPTVPGKKIRRGTPNSEMRLVAQGYAASLRLVIEEPYPLIGHSDIFLVEQVRSGDEDLALAKLVADAGIPEEHGLRVDEAGGLLGSRVIISRAIISPLQR